MGETEITKRKTLIFLNTTDRIARAVGPFTMEGQELHFSIAGFLWYHANFKMFIQFDKAFISFNEGSYG